MPKVTPHKPGKDVIQAKTAPPKKEVRNDWWNAASNRELADGLVGTVDWLKKQNVHRYNQANLHAILYGNTPLFGWNGSGTIGKPGAKLPMDRPTMSVITSCIDTLVSRVTQSRPRPIFLTDNGDYKQRNLATQLNQFIAGEFHQTDTYALTTTMLRDACALGTGVIKVLETDDKRVGLERRLCTELLVDPNDAMYGSPRQKFELKLMARDVAYAAFPKYASMIERADQAFPDEGQNSGSTITDQIIIAEGFHLRSGMDATDGMHAIACSAGLLFEEKWDKKQFPYVEMPFSPRLLGAWGQGLCEQLMGTQVEINKLLATISDSINLVGVPRVFVEEGSKIVKAHLNNQVGSIVTYRGTPPKYEVAPCVPAELYSQLQRLVEYAYQQSGVSAMSASSKKPQGLDSGAAIREYDDLQTDRFAALEKRFENAHIDLAYLMIDQAKDIAARDGKYQSVYPDKDGTREIDLPASKLLDNPFVIQCYDVSSLPRDPAGRKQYVIDMMQAGIYTPQEGRRLLNLPDTAQEDKLANAAEERILKILDDIVTTGKFEPPDPFTDLAMAETKVVQYYNLYVANKLEASKAQLLRNWYSQIGALKAQAAGPAQPSAPDGSHAPANPDPAPQSDMLPNGNQPGMPGQPGA